MTRKQSNLAIAADVTTKAALLSLAEAAGPYICVLKTHIDILLDFDQEVVQSLKNLASTHDFLIFEDRKFADIGNTVELQYSSGIYRISSWSDITNAHIIPGEGIIEGLKKVGFPLGRGLLLLAEMSSKGALATGSYTETAMLWARKHREFVFGFIGQRRLELPTASSSASSITNGDGTDKDTSNHTDQAIEDFIYMTPGVQLYSKSDALGQQYRTPRQVIFESGCDVIIVGRGIYGGLSEVEIATSGDAKEVVRERCVVYRKEGWEAYLERCRG